MLEVVSGLEVNLAKSNLVLAVSSLTLKYLAFRWELLFKAKSIWDSVIRKIEHRLASRKRIYMSLFPLPAGVAKKGYNRLSYGVG